MATPSSTKPTTELKPTAAPEAESVKLAESKLTTSKDPAKPAVATTASDVPKDTKPAAESKSADTTKTDDAKSADSVKSAAPDVKAAAAPAPAKEEVKPAVDGKAGEGKTVQENSQRYAIRPAFKNK